MSRINLLSLLLQMSKSYVSIVKKNTNKTKITQNGQSMPRSGHENIMIPNLAGGFTYKVSDKEYLERILILGTNGNTYYASAIKMTADAINHIKDMINSGKGQLVVDTMKDIYENGRAPKQDATFFALALITQSDVPMDVKKVALELVSKVRTFSQLYMLESMRKSIGGKKGFGRGMRRAMFNLINNKTGKQFAYQATKYRSRTYGDETWSIDDIIKCSHIPSKKLKDDGKIVLIYLINGIAKSEEEYLKLENPSIECTETISYLRAVEAVKKESCTIDTAVQLIRQYNLPREVLNTSLLNYNLVWNSLLFSSTVGEGGKIIRKVIMPITALFRNLGVMTQRGLFVDNDITNLIAEHIKKPHILKNGRVHPVAVLVAKLTYDMGKGVKGKLNWIVNKTISNALEESFYNSFQIIEGTGKRILHAVDCSGSMTCKIASAPYISSCEAVSTLVMEAIRREHKHAINMKAEGKEINNLQEVMLFSVSANKVTITPDMKLQQVMKICQSDFQSTDASMPMIKALEEYKKTNGKSGAYDLFIVYTDNETYYGKIHPSEALDNYRKYTNIDARMVIYATTPTQNTIGYTRESHHDAFSTKEGYDNSLSLNIAGFDLNGPTLIRNFAIGSIGVSSEDEEDSEIE